MEQSLLFFVYFKKVIPDLPVLSLSKDRASMSVFIHRYIGITSLLKVTDYVDSRLRGNDRLFVMSGKR